MSEPLIAFAQAMKAAANGKLVTRGNRKNGWHFRIIRPHDLQDGAGLIPILRACNGWPLALVHHHAALTAEDILAEDWRIMDPSEAICGEVEVEIIPW